MPWKKTASFGFRRGAKSAYRFFHLKSGTTTPSSTAGHYVPNYRGFCQNCWFRPDPLVPGFCFCNDPEHECQCEVCSATRARARIARTRGNDS